MYTYMTNEYANRKIGKAGSSQFSQLYSHLWWQPAVKGRWEIPQMRSFLTQYPF